MILFKPKPHALQAAKDLALQINQNAAAYWSNYAQALGMDPRPTGLDAVPEHLTALYRIYAECLALHYFFFNSGLVASNGAQARHSLYPVIYHHLRAIPASLARNKLLWIREAAPFLLRYTQFLSLLMQSGGANSRFIKTLSETHLAAIYTGFQPDVISKLSNAANTAFRYQIQSYLDGQPYRRKINEYSWKGADTLLRKAYCKIQEETHEQLMKAQKVSPEAAPPNTAAPNQPLAQRSQDPSSTVIRTQHESN